MSTVDATGSKPPSPWIGFLILAGILALSIGLARILVP